MTKPLYKISNEYCAALDDLTSSAELLSPQIIEDSLAPLKGQLKEKSLNVAAYIKSIENNIAMMKEYEEAIKKRRASAEKHIESMKDYLLINMKRCGINKIIGVEFDIQIRNNPDSLEVYNEPSIPKKFFKEEVFYKLDKNLVKKEIKKGIDVPGTLLVKKESLIIK